MSFKIGEPLKELPKKLEGRGCYVGIRDAAVRANGDWVPVEFGTPEAASRAGRSCIQSGKFQLRRRGNKLYIRLRPKEQA